MRQGSMADFLVKRPATSINKENEAVKVAQEVKTEVLKEINQVQNENLSEQHGSDDLELEKMEQEERELLEEERQSQLLGIRKSSRIKRKSKQRDDSDSEEEEQFKDSDIYQPNEDEDDESDYEPGRKNKKKKKGKGFRREKMPHSLNKAYRDDYESSGDLEQPSNVMMNAPVTEKELLRLKQDLEDEKFRVEEQYFAVQCQDTQNLYVKDSIDSVRMIIPPLCIPVNGNVKRMNLKEFGKQVKAIKGKLFDVITMDPPWELSSAQPTRGVAIGYDTMSDDDIKKMDVQSLQEAGFIFIWVINAKYHCGLKLIQHWGYKFCTVINWVKQTKTGGIAKGHGFYLQHAKESCLVGVKNRDKISVDILHDQGLDILFSRRQGQSQKPGDIYELIQQVMPNALCLEIFGRRNNLRNFWVTIGNEI